MKLYEIDKADLRKHGSAKNAIVAGSYVLRDDDFITCAFNFGHGTIADMNRYIRDNSIFCIWIDASTMQRVYSVSA